jgi:hypothetical protein
MPEYAHTLIPERFDFVPLPDQVGAFLSSLISIGAAPLSPTIYVSKLSGKVDNYINPFTGETVSVAGRKSKKLKHVDAVARELKALDDFNVSVDGKGPPSLPAFVFDFQGSYDFSVQCQLRAEVVSTSNWHDDLPIGRKVEFFGKPCSPADRLGIFHNPNTGEVIEVPNAGCARFWIGFEFGKMLFPAIDRSLDLIEPKIVETAERDFGIKFVQGCCWDS